MSGFIKKLSSTVSSFSVCSPSAVTLYSPAGISGTSKLASQSPAVLALMSVTTASPSNNIVRPFSLLANLLPVIFTLSPTMPDDLSMLVSGVTLKVASSTS